MMTFRQAVVEAMALQARIGAPLADVEVTTPRADTAHAYLMFSDREWHCIAFRAVPFDRERLERAFIAACAYDSNGVTVH